MIRNWYFFSATLGAICALAASLAAPANAASINYGDFSDIPPGAIVYEDVTESSPSGDSLPQFGAPEVEINELDFEPTGFGASASGGDIDITDGQLNFAFQTYPNAGVTAFNISEGGDYSFLGGMGSTLVTYSVFAEVTVMEVNGVPLTPANFLTVNISNSGVITAPGGFVPNTAWSLETLFEFGGALSTKYGPGSAATGGEFVLNNTLIAASESGPNTLAFIAKKDFTIDPKGPIEMFDVPEPTAALLLGLSLAGLIARRR